LPAAAAGPAAITGGGGRIGAGGLAHVRLGERARGAACSADRARSACPTAPRLRDGAVRRVGRTRDRIGGAC
jgi:hypothetical protein